MDRLMRAMQADIAGLQARQVWHTVATVVTVSPLTVTVGSGDPLPALAGGHTVVVGDNVDVLATRTGPTIVLNVR